MIAMVHVDVLAKVGLDARHAHVEQGFQQLILIPVNGFVVGEVDGAGIVEGGEIRSTARIVSGRTADLRSANIVVCLRLCQLFSASCYVGKLP